MESTGVIAVDDGGSSTCVMTKSIQESFPSVKGLYGKRTLTDANGKYDYVVEYKGKKYAMGTLAKYDCKYPLQMHTDTKQNIFFDLSVLVSIHQFGYLNNYVIVSVPISMHNHSEKSGRINRLVGSHTISVNGRTKTFKIINANVAPETAVSFWIDSPKGKNRFIDLGSRTIGYSTTMTESDSVRFIDGESGTFNGMGLEALDDKYDQKSLADYICGKLMAIWSVKDKVYLIGGGAEDLELVKYIGGYFENVKVINNPQMANVNGMFRLGVMAYGIE